MRPRTLTWTVGVLVILILFHPGANAQEPDGRPDSVRTGENNLRTALVYTSAYYAASMLILGKTWYKDRSIVPFHFYDDTKAYLQVDKFGHTFGAYVYSYIGYHYLLHAGLSRNEALLYGATLGFVLQAPIEIMDGIHEGYGFSWGDMAANAMGSALVLGQELLFNEQVVKYKFSYWSSSYADQANGYLGSSPLDRLLTDYNGHTYWLSMPAQRVVGSDKTPPWLNIAIGYGANGMFGEFENISRYNGVAIPKTIRYRQLLFSLDIDWTRIETGSSFLDTILKGLTFVKLPFPALEYNSLGKLRWYWLYY